MIGAYLSVSIVNFAVIGYPFNCLDGQLNCQVFTHCIISRATKLLTVQLVIVAWHTPPTAFAIYIVIQVTYNHDNSILF